MFFKKKIPDYRTKMNEQECIDVNGWMNRWQFWWGTEWWHGFSAATHQVLINYKEQRVASWRRGLADSTTEVETKANIVSNGPDQRCATWSCLLRTGKPLARAASPESFFFFSTWGEINMTLPSFLSHPPHQQLSHWASLVPLLLLFLPSACTPPLFTLWQSCREAVELARVLCTCGRGLREQNRTPQYLVQSLYVTPPPLLPGPSCHSQRLCILPSAVFQMHTLTPGPLHMQSALPKSLFPPALPSFRIQVWPAWWSTRRLPEGTSWRELNKVFFTGLGTVA